MCPQHRIVHFVPIVQSYENIQGSDTYHKLLDVIMCPQHRIVHFVPIVQIYENIQGADTLISSVMHLQVR